MTSRKIRLPHLPKGREFEEYVSSCLQMGGFYIERNIVERDIEEVLELDIILTNYSTQVPDVTLVEAKSGKWGFSDLFKMSGWMNYLNIQQGMLVSDKEPSNVQFIKEKSNQLRINVKIVPDLNDCMHVLAELLPPESICNIDSNDIENWRFSYWIERNLLKRLTHQRKSHPDKKCFKAATDYYFEINSGIFFTENIIRKISSLYHNFLQYPNITAKTAHELIGESFDEDYDSIPYDLYKETFYDCVYNDIQACLFVEHKSRLAILKNAVDYLLYKEANVTAKTGDIAEKILGIEFNLIDSLPSSFIAGLESLKKHKYFRMYPTFWQWFMWNFGGFILTDYEEQEYSIISKKTGIPEDEIQNALDSYNILFPLADGWFDDLSPHSAIKRMKMFPVPFMGVGANYRREMYAGKENDEVNPVSKIPVSTPLTRRDLVKWNNCGFQVLKQT